MPPNLPLQTSPFREFSVMFHYKYFASSSSFNPRRIEPSANPIISFFTYAIISSVSFLPVTYPLLKPFLKISFTS